MVDERGKKLVFNQIQFSVISDFIMNCESGGNPKVENWNDAKITGYPSIGLYQFQWKTWASFAEKYFVLKNATKLSYDQVLPYLYNPVYNAAVAHGMIKDGLLSHWKICSEKMKKSLSGLF